MKKLLHWFSNKGLLVVALFLLAFIPLYPKLPLIDIVHTWVYIRLEDFFVAFACLALIILKVRQRQMVHTPLNVPILVYFGVLSISLLNAILFIFPLFSDQLFTHLALLHLARRIEYISVFFLAFEAFRRAPRLQMVIGVLAVTYACVLLYGAGQKFFGFPAFLTMNEEFAKGIPLRLPATARIPSTFGGHYDLGAFLVFTIPIMGSLVFAVKQWYSKLLFFLLALGGLIVLLFTASRISFGVYLIAVSIMLVWQKKVLLIVPVILLSILVLNLTSGASERFYKTFRVSNVVVDLSTGKPIGTLDKLEGGSAKLEKIESPAEESLPKGSEFINIPTMTVTSKEEPVEPIKKIEYLAGEGLQKATGEVATISGSFLVQKALVYDISITTRFQGQWPRAIEAFRRNILLGSGLSSLSVAADGDYHRMLGETGLLGTVAFLGIFLVAYIVFFRLKDKQTDLGRSFAIGIFAGLSGLLCNAILIDVFEASKVAFTLWLLLGFALALLTQSRPIHISYIKVLKNVFIHPVSYIVYLCVAVWIIWYQSLSVYFLGDDFTWTRWAAQSSFGDIIAYFTDSQGFFYRPIPKTWYFVLFSVFWLRPVFYHITSLLMVCAIVVFMYVFLKKLNVGWIIAWISAFLFATLSVHHENIYWISGHSSLLSALFLTGGLVLYQRVWTEVSKKSWIYAALCGLCIFSSMLSYDGMVVAPLVVCIVGIGLYGRWKTAWILCLIPLYMLMRSMAGALGPSGDYSYKWSTFGINSIANILAYIGAIVAGPQALDVSLAMRTSLKSYLFHVTLIASALVIVCTALVWKMRKKLVFYRSSIVLCIAGLVSSIAYIGLGSVSERYAFIPSIFFCMAIGSFIHVLLSRHKSWILKVGIVVTVVALCWWNIKQTQKIGNDWIKAGNIAETSLLAIKRDAFPPTQDVSFFIINMPIRYGRAWVFPTGMTDALWHMFRETLYAVYPMPTIQSAYEYRTYKGIRYVYVFEDYVLKKGVEQVTEVPYEE